LEIKKNIWKKGLRKNTSMKNLGPCHRVEKEIHAKKREGLLIIKREERGGISICGKSAEERVYLTL